MKFVITLFNLVAHIEIFQKHSYRTVVALVHFASGLPDFHVFRMKNGQVDLIQAVIGAGSKTMGWPNEQVCK